MNDKEQKRIFANNLKRLLNENRLNQNEVAKSINVSPQTFNTWCQEIALPRMGKIELLANYFGITKSELIEERKPNYQEYEEITNLIDIEDLDLQPILHITNFVASCGNGIDFEELEDNKEIIYLPTELVGTDTKNSWVMHTTGDSMNKIIPKNSKIIVKQKEYYQNGDIVLYKVSDSFAIKEYYAYKDRIVLKPQSYNLIHSQETYRYEDRDNGFEFPIILGKVTGFYGSI